MPDSPTPIVSNMTQFGMPTIPTQDDVSPQPSAIQGSMNKGDVTDVSDKPAAPPPAPTQHPTFFRRLLFSLGQGLIEGTKAGLQAPLSPQGPAVAAQTAINAPQAKREQMTTNQMNDLNVAMTQLKLHQTQMITHQMEEEQQNAVYNSGRDVTTALMEKGKVDVLTSGDLKSVQDEFNRRQADAKQSGQGLLPLQILPAAGSSAKDPKYSLINVGKDRLTEDMDTTFGADDLGISKEDFDKTGLTPFKFHAPAGMDQQKALQLMVTQHLNWLTKSQNQLGQWKRTQLQETGRNKRAAATNDVRLKIADLNNITRRAIADKKAADASGDKLKISALGKLVTAAKNFGDAQGKIGNKAWDTLTDAETKELTTKRAALDEAKKAYDQITQKQSTAVSDLKQAVGITKVPKGTKLTRDVAAYYLQKAGGDRPKAEKMAKDDGYE